ncbi:MAG: protein phosphatase CheZ [Burkholderiales bacterium]|nr:protein phosphatase CheZ [Burkholderiales bacterium]
MDWWHVRPAAPAPAPAPAPADEDDLDALFEQNNSVKTPAPAAASVDEDDMDALFALAASSPPVVLSPPPAAPAKTHEPPGEEFALTIGVQDADIEISPEMVAAAEVVTDVAHERPMYERLGAIVRLLHDSMRELGYDKALTEASSQISDAQDRLEYVATLTEQAANKVLNTLDDGMPAQDDLSKEAKKMETRWQQLFEGKISLDEFKVLAGDSKQFAIMVGEATEKEKARLLEIMMAQDFQDITGQLIKKVVNITKTVEKELAELLRDNAPPAIREKIHKPAQLMQGPSVPTTALDQDNVDDLLADLGF